MADKVTLRQFSEKLREYESGGAARKAVGRFSGWTEEEKARAHRMIDSQFGPGIKKEMAEPPRRRGRPPKNAALLGAAPKRRGRPPKNAVASAPATAPKRRGRPPKSSYATAAAAVSPAAVSAPAPAHSPKAETKKEVDPNTSARFLAERSLQALSTAIANTEAMHRIQPSICLDGSIKKMVELHNATLDIFAQALKGAVEVRAEKVPTAARRGRPPKTETEQPRGNGQGALEVGLELPPLTKAAVGSTSI